MKINKIRAATENVINEDDNNNEIVKKTRGVSKKTTDGAFGSTQLSSKTKHFRNCK